MLDKTKRCEAYDGQERCCLVKDHPPPCMGRWYTMEQSKIDEFLEKLSSLTDEQKKALGY